MPEMSGLEVAHAVRALPLPCAVVFLTAFDEHALAAFDAQAVDYLLKPVDEQRLAQTAQRLRERHAQHQPVAGCRQGRGLDGLNRCHHGGANSRPH